MSDNVTTHPIRTDYDGFLETVVENNIERDGSSWEHVANVVIVATEYIEGEGWTLRFSARPYYEEPRVYPADVLREATNPVNYPFDTTPDGDLREIAVQLLAHDLARKADELGVELP